MKEEMIEINGNLMVPGQNYMVDVTWGFQRNDKKGKVEGIIEEFGLGIKNEMGVRLTQFCQEQNMTIAKTFYKPSDKYNTISRIKIYYALINKL